MSKVINEIKILFSTPAPGLYPQSIYLLAIISIYTTYSMIALSAKPLALLKASNNIFVIYQFKYKPIKIFKYLLELCWFAINLISTISKNILMPTLLLNSTKLFYVYTD